MTFPKNNLPAGTRAAEEEFIFEEEWCLLGCYAVWLL
jgi:hypothetical protein